MARIGAYARAEFERAGEHLAVAVANALARLRARARARRRPRGRGGAAASLAAAAEAGEFGGEGALREAVSRPPALALRGVLVDVPRRARGEADTPAAM